MSLASRLYTIPSSTPQLRLIATQIQHLSSKSPQVQTTIHRQSHFSPVQQALKFQFHTPSQIQSRIRASPEKAILPNPESTLGCSLLEEIQSQCCVLVNSLFTG